MTESIAFKEKTEIQNNQFEKKLNNSDLTVYFGKCIRAKQY